MDSTDPDVDALRSRLVAVLAAMPGAAIAFSGGVDSAVVAKAAAVALGARTVAVTADSPSVPRAELTAAAATAAIIGIRHRIVQTDEFDRPDYTKNDGTRCYHCKTELYSQIVQLLPELGVDIVCSGANLDDLGDYRPGLTAAAEHGVRHPLQEAGLTKADVRRIARSWNLPVWDKPASPCLSSRIAPGLEATAERTGRVERAEELLHRLGLRECRVRYHDGDLARVEVPAAEIARLAADDVRTGLAAGLHAIGFRYVTLDLDGFRSGNLNEMIPLAVRTRPRPS